MRILWLNSNIISSVDRSPSLFLLLTSFIFGIAALCLAGFFQLINLDQLESRVRKQLLAFSMTAIPLGFCCMGFFISPNTVLRFLKDSSLGTLMMIIIFLVIGLTYGAGLLYHTLREKGNRTIGETVLMHTLLWVFIGLFLGVTLLLILLGPAVIIIIETFFL